MSKKQWVLVSVALVLAVLYVIYFTNWFKPKIIHISYTERSIRLRGRPGTPTILFGFGGQRYRLTEIKVVPLDAWQTNHFILPVWDLNSTTNSVPMTAFSYGQRLRGMNPVVPGARPEPLQTNVTYRIFVWAGSRKGQCDFQLGGKPPADSAP
jgi:hypothetical protein